MLIVMKRDVTTLVYSIVFGDLFGTSVVHGMPMGPRESWSIHEILELRMCTRNPTVSRILQCIWKKLRCDYH